MRREELTVEASGSKMEAFYRPFLRLALMLRRDRSVSIEVDPMKRLARAFQPDGKCLRIGFPVHLVRRDRLYYGEYRD